MKKVILILTLLILCGCNKPAKSNIISVSLKCNPSTEHNWVYTISDSEVIKTKLTTYSIDENEEYEGTYTYIFNVLGDGKATINFKYLKDWEDEEMYNIKYEIEVKKGKINVIDSKGKYFDDKIPELKIMKESEIENEI